MYYNLFYHPCYKQVKLQTPLSRRQLLFIPRRINMFMDFRNNYFTRCIFSVNNIRALNISFYISSKVFIFSKIQFNSSWKLTKICTGRTVFVSEEIYVLYTIGSQYREILWLQTETDHSPCSLYLWKCSYFADGFVFLKTAVALCRQRSHGVDISPALGSSLFNQTV